MKRVVPLTFSMAALLALLILFGGTRHGSTVYALQGTPAAPPAVTLAAPPEIPGDTKTIAFDRPIIEGLDANNAIRFYKFMGKAGQMVRLSVETKTGDFYTTISILSGDLEAVIGGTIGENLVSGSVVVKLPSDGMYIITVEYADSMVGTPTPGSYEIALTEVKAK